MSGTIDGTLSSGETVSQHFKQATAEDLNPNADCDIITLDLGPIPFEVLGLQVDLSQVALAVTGETGAGNLLCAIADIGADGGLSNLLNSIISALNNLLNQLLG